MIDAGIFGVFHTQADANVSDEKQKRAVQFEAGLLRFYLAESICDIAFEFGVCDEICTGFERWSVI
jgi:hypothetical protein